MGHVDEIRERLGAADTDDYLDWRVIPRQYGPCEACGRAYADHRSTAGADHQFMAGEQAHGPYVVDGDYVDEGEPDVSIEVVSEHEHATAEFIAAAPNDIRYLLDLLGPDYHIAQVGDDGWTLQHPIACRRDLLSCPYNAAMHAKGRGFFDQPGRYRVDLIDGQAVLGGAEPEPAQP